MQYFRYNPIDRLKTLNAFPWHHILLSDKELNRFLYDFGRNIFIRNKTKWNQKYTDSSYPVLYPEIYEWFQSTYGPEYSEYWNKIDRIYFETPFMEIVKYSKDWRKVYGFISDDQKKYRLDLKNNTIYFKKDSDAILFKLTWG